MNDTAIGVPGDGAEVLGDLRGVPVRTADAVRTGRAHDLGAEQVRLRGLARARGAGHCDDHDLGLDQSHRGRECQGRDRRVAAGHGDPPGVAELLALTGQLGQAVGPATGMFAAVPAFPRPRVGEPVVGATVDDDRVVAEVRGDLGRVTVWQREENDVVAFQRRQRSSRSSTRSASGSRCGWCANSVLPAFPPGGERADLHVRVRQQQPEQLASGVAARSRDRDPNRHADNYAR